MAIHELATNSVKHGALSSRNGRIEVWWEVHNHENENEFRLRWQEWGSLISREPSRRGFGSEFLEKLVPHMLHGEFERKFKSDGLECTISFVLSA
jgi:two-component sensor histidine kinase